MLHQFDRKAHVAGLPARGAKVTFALVETAAAFDALGQAWRALTARTAKPHQVFQCHSWLRHWCAHYQDAENDASEQLAVVVAMRGDDIVLALPLIVRRRFGVRMLNWMGAPVSQYGDVICDDHPAAQHLIRSALAFAGERTGCDLIVLRKVREDARVSPVLAALGARVLLESEAPFVDLAACPDGESHLRRLSGGARKQRRRRRRRLEEHGPVDFAFLSPSSEAGRQARVAVRDKRATLSAARAWNALDDRFEAFFASYCARPEDDVRAVVATLSSGGKAVAREIGLIHKGHYVAHVGSFDAGYAACAPGTLQIDETIKACVAAGLHTYDMLAPADDYKLAFATGSVTVRDWALPRTARGAFYCRVAEGLVPRLKMLRDKLGETARRWQRSRRAGR